MSEVQPNSTMNLSWKIKYTYPKHLCLKERGLEKKSYVGKGKREVNAEKKRSVVIKHPTEYWNATSLPSSYHFSLAAKTLYIHITFQQKGPFLAHATGQHFLSFTDDNCLDRTAQNLAYKWAQTPKTLAMYWEIPLKTRESSSKGRLKCLQRTV